MHSRGLQTHFKAVVVSEQFAGLNSVQEARQQPFERWVKAIGLPPTGDAPLGQSWQALVARDEQAWQVHPGIGAQRAAHLHEFLRDPNVLALSEQLRAAGIDGFD